MDLIEINDSENEYIKQEDNCTPTEKFKLKKPIKYVIIIDDSEQFYTFYLAFSTPLCYFYVFVKIFYYSNYSNLISTQIVN